MSSESSSMSGRSLDNISYRGFNQGNDGELSNVKDTETTINIDADKLLTERELEDR